MRKTLIYTVLFFALLFTAPAVNAQTYKIVPEKNMTITLNENGYHEYEIFVVNTTKDSITLHWKMMYDNIGKVSDWQYSFCDNVNCYLDIPPYADMNPIGPGDSAFFKLGFDPSGVKDTGSMKFVFWDNAAPTHTDTVMFTVNSMPLSIGKIKYDKSISIYPNPAQNFLKINMNDRVVGKLNASIYNVVGQKIKDLSILGVNSLINIEDLDAGVYFLMMQDKTGKQYKTQFYKTN